MIFVEKFSTSGNQALLMLFITIQNKYGRVNTFEGNGRFMTADHKYTIIYEHNKVSDKFELGVWENES
jgi:hypothetical protein